MTTLFKKKFKKTILFLSILFIAFFVFRFVYGYYKTDAEYANYSNDFFSNLGSSLRKNYASEKFSFTPKNNMPQSNFAESQKYEKTGSIKSKTSQFEEDESSIKKFITKFNAVTQYEQNLGKKGNREEHLVIGVTPDLFDSTCAALKQIGDLKSIEITKVDKTNEYRQLNAKKSSLDKTLQSLNELKSRGGQISDYITLHDKILEIETQLQELGVQLGDFNEANEFCTIKFSLYEGASEKKVSLFQRIKTSLEWTIKYYSLFILALFGIVCVSFITILIIDKLGIIKRINE